MLPARHERRGAGSTPLPAVEDAADARAAEARAAYRRDKARFEDPDFPATDASLGPGKAELRGESQFSRHGFGRSKGRVTWERPNVLRDDEDAPLDSDGSGPAVGSGRRRRARAWGRRYCVDREGMRAGDCAQRALGDCWLVSAAAVAAESSRALTHAVRTPKRQANGLYQLRLCVGGVWCVVDVDSRLPAVRSKRVLAFTSAVGRQIWPALLEKAVAKVSGSFAAVEGGRVGEGLGLLTGAPHVVAGLSARGGGTLLAPVVSSFRRRWTALEGAAGWERLRGWAADGRLMGASVGAGPSEGAGAATAAEAGLVTTHAYSLLGVSRCGPHRLVRLRNPWHRGEWRGRFSDGWGGWTPEGRAEAGCRDDDGDGAFLMEWSDFCAYFNSVDVALEVRDDPAAAGCEWWSERRTLLLPPQPSAASWPAVRVTGVPPSTELTVSAHQPSDRVRRWFERNALLNAGLAEPGAEPLRTAMGDLGLAVLSEGPSPGPGAATTTAEVAGRERETRAGSVLHGWSTPRGPGPGAGLLVVPLSFAHLSRLADEGGEDEAEVAAGLASGNSSLLRRRTGRAAAGSGVESSAWDQAVTVRVAARCEGFRAEAASVPASAVARLLVRRCRRHGERLPLGPGVAAFVLREPAGWVVAAANSGSSPVCVSVAAPDGMLSARGPPRVETVLPPGTAAVVHIASAARAAARPPTAPPAPCVRLSDGTATKPGAAAASLFRPFRVPSTGLSQGVVAAVLGAATALIAVLAWMLS